MHVWRGVFGKLKIAPSGAVPFGGGQIVPISGVEQSTFGFKETVLRQPVLEFGGETTRQILLYDMRALFRGCGGPRERLMPGLGRLEIGETSVFIAVSAPHRPAAFEACRHAIDTLKRTVPIWKKEYFEDGAVWADGELPPAPQDTAATKRAS